VPPPGRAVPGPGPFAEPLPTISGASWAPALTT